MSPFVHLPNQQVPNHHTPLKTMRFLTILITLTIPISAQVYSPGDGDANERRDANREATQTRDGNNTAKALIMAHPPLLRAKIHPPQFMGMSCPLLTLPKKPSLLWDTPSA